MKIIYIIIIFINLVIPNIGLAEWQTESKVEYQTRGACDWDTITLKIVTFGALFSCQCVQVKDGESKYRIYCPVDGGIAFRSVTKQPTGMASP